MSGVGLGRVKTPMFNLRVEIPSRFRKFENQKCVRPPLREDDRENNSAHSWLVHVFTQPGSKPEKLAMSTCFPLCPRNQTLRYALGMSVSCQERTLAQNNKSLACNNKTSADCPVKAGSLVELRRCRQATWRVDPGRHSAPGNYPIQRHSFPPRSHKPNRGEKNRAIVPVVFRAT